MPLAGARILLIGMRGSGKTTVGRRLADELGTSFADLDDYARQHLGGLSVRAIWEQQGEASWRRAEAEAFSELIRNAPTDRTAVIALGGGAPLVPSIREVLRNLADKNRRVQIIWLKADASTIQERLRQEESDRPSLTGGDVVDEIQTVLAEREPVYRSLASISVAVDGLNVDEVVAQVLTELDRTDHAAR